MATSGLQTVFQYRSTVLVSAVTVAAATGLLIQLWRGVYAGRPGGTVGGYDLPQLTTYLLAAQLLAVSQANRVDEVVAGEVRRGDIAVALVRPVSYPLTRLVASLPVSLANATLVGVPVLVVYAALLPLAVPAWHDVPLFAVAAACSLLIAFAVNLLVGLAGLVSTNVWGLRVVKDSVVALLAGQLVPVDVMPPAVARLARSLPFQALVDAPARLLLGRYADPAEAGRILAGQVFWAGALALLVAGVWRLAVRRLEVQGG